MKPYCHLGDKLVHREDESFTADVTLVIPRGAADWWYHLLVDVGAGVIFDEQAWTHEELIKAWRLKKDGETNIPGVA